MRNKELAQTKLSVVIELDELHIYSDIFRRNFLKIYSKLI